nr:MAG TPA: hypothetical protein [Caudoviricetes sp.]
MSLYSLSIIFLSSLISSLMSPLFFLFLETA